jgi:beta-glucosidase
MNKMFSKKNLVRKIVALFVFTLLFLDTLHAQTRLDARVDSVFTLMTLDEKLGQLAQLPSRFDNTTKRSGTIDAQLAQVRDGKAGSILMCQGVEVVRAYQDAAMQSRLKIPLIFGFDVIHGFRTTFPIPLAESCSWDTALAYTSARIAATEAAAAGINWTFAPMVDIARDPRWGRVIEGAGEDTHLGSAFAFARVRGFQGDNLAAPNTIAACAKHFAAYGAAEGGRDYNTADVSERTLREIYLPPFKACVDAGAATFMCSFNEVAGVPSSINKMLLTDILRNEWKFNGFVVSDWESINEVVNHRAATNNEDAAIKSLVAGVDMDMSGNLFVNLSNAVKNGTLPESAVNTAVKRILRIKLQLGLFDNPYLYCDAEREKAAMLTAAHRAAARLAAQKSMVLLKNQNSTLPLSKSVSSVAVIGALADSKRDILGGWEMVGRPEDAVSILEGITSKTTAKVLYAKGYTLPEPNWKKIKGDVKEPADAELVRLRSEAIRTAKKASVIVAVVGETADLTSEAHSRASIDLPTGQEDLLKELKKLGKPLVVVLANGRPLSVTWAQSNADAILNAWHAGTETGNAAADILFGDVNPSAKLTMSFPRSVGQVPVYYNHKSTGRPSFASNQSERYKSKYVDLPDSPLYAFGYGLSYTTFEYSSVSLSAAEIPANGSIRASVTVRNTGSRAGEEIVQMYVRDEFASVTRPVKELKGFKKVFLNAGESATVDFVIGEAELSFYNLTMTRVVEPGKFNVFIGGSSEKTMNATFEVK